MSSGKHVRGCVCKKCISTTTLRRLEDEHEAAGKPDHPMLVAHRAEHQTKGATQMAVFMAGKARDTTIAAGEAAVSVLGADDTYQGKTIFNTDIILI